MIIRGIGVDLVEVRRIERLVDRWGDRFLKRVFTDRELELCARKRRWVECLASRFAAKEAFLKAMGTGIRAGIRWTDVEVLREKGAPPYIELDGRAKELFSSKSMRHIWVSITHDGGLAVASVTIEG